VGDLIGGSGQPGGSGFLEPGMKDVAMAAFNHS
jgi:hypothetical protein